MRREKRINYCTSKFRSVNVTNKLTTPLIIGSKYCRERQRRGRMNNKWFARDKIKKKRITYLTQIHIVENSDFHCCHINCDNKDDFKLTK